MGLFDLFKTTKARSNSQVKYFLFQPFLNRTSLISKHFVAIATKQPATTGKKATKSKQ